MSSVLFIGLGRMGRPMSTLVARRFATTVFDVSAEAVEQVVEAVPGTRGIASLDEIAADTVVLMLPTSAHVERVLLDGGLLDRLERSALVIDMGSSEPASTRRLSAIAADRGIDYVDAPVSGGTTKAESGDLTILIGGESAAIERARPVLEAMGSTLVEVGPSGSGHAAKAINNLVSATNIAVASEAVLLAGEAGIPATRMIEVLNASTGMSQATQVKFPRHILPGAYDSGFAYDLMLKDMRIALNIDDEREIAHLTRLAFQTLESARPRLGDAADHTEVTRIVELASHRTIRN